MARQTDGEKFGKRTVIKITVKSEIDFVFRQSKNDNALFIVQAGEESFRGTLADVREDVIALEMNGRPESVWWDDSSLTHWVYGHLQALNTFITFDTNLKHIDEVKVREGSHKFIWLLERPRLLLRSMARYTRIEPASPIFLEIPSVTPSELKRQQRNLISMPNEFGQIKKIDDVLLSEDSFDFKVVMSLIGQELIRLTGAKASEKRFNFKLKGYSEDNWQMMDDLWIENTQGSQIGELDRTAYEQKNIGSIVVSRIDTQLNDNVGYIICTRGLDARGFSIFERDYIHFLGTRMLAALRRFKNIINVYTVDNISEEGVFIEQSAKDFSNIPVDTVIRDIRLHINADIPSEYLTVHASIARLTEQGCGLRLIYNDPQTRQKIRQFVQKELRKNWKTGEKES